MMGTALEYYDVALYAFLAPILAPLFLPDLETNNAFLVFFMVYGISMAVRPIGGYIFGTMGDRVGRCIPLSITMLGMSCCSIVIAFMPVYEVLGYYAIIVFTILRALQNFFISGEYYGGAIYCLEHTKNIFKPGTISGFYCASTVCGILIAAVVSSLVACYGNQYWRLAYILGAFGCISAIMIRKKLWESVEFLSYKRNQVDATYEMNRALFTTCILLSTCALFFTVLYSLSAKVLNVIIPQSSEYTADVVLHVNSMVMMLYGILLIAAGFLSNKLGAIRQMQLFAFSTAIVIIPLLYMPITHLYTIFIMKFVLILLVAGFVAPIHVLTIEMLPVLKRYKIASIYSSLGKLLAGFAPALYIYLWDLNGGSMLYIGIFIACLAIFTWGILNLQSKQTDRDQNLVRTPPKSPAGSSQPVVEG